MAVERGKDRARDGHTMEIGLYIISLAFLWDYGIWVMHGWGFYGNGNGNGCMSDVMQRAVCAGWEG